MKERMDEIIIAGIFVLMVLTTILLWGFGWDPLSRAYDDRAEQEAAEVQQSEDLINQMGRETYSVRFKYPTAADDFKNIWTPIIADQIYTITSVSCESDGIVYFDLQIDRGSPGRPVEVNGSDFACSAYATYSTLAGHTRMTAGDKLNLEISSVFESPTWVLISWTVENHIK